MKQKQFGRIHYWGEMCEDIIDLNETKLFKLLKNILIELVFLKLKLEGTKIWLKKKLRR